jgi:small subunit ribosomal protein S7
MRKTRAKKRPLLPDPKFNDILVTRFVNNLMYQGKKSTAYDIFYDAMEIVTKRSEQDGLETWKKALANVTPNVEVRSRRVGGATFQIPQEIRSERKTALGIKWLISYARARNEKSMAAKLAGEIVAAAKEEGAAFKKKEDTHRMAEANKAYSHFRL